MRLLRIAEVQTVRRRYRHTARTDDLARCFSYRVHRSQFGIQVTPSAIAVERHRQATQGVLDAHYAAVPARTLHGIGLHHRVVLLVNPALGADVLGSEQSLKHSG